MPEPWCPQTGVLGDMVKSTKGMSCACPSGLLDLWSPSAKASSSHRSMTSFATLLLLLLCSDHGPKHLDLFSSDWNTHQWQCIPKDIANDVSQHSVVHGVQPVDHRHVH